MIAQWTERHLGELPQHLDEVAGLELLARRRHEQRQHLAGVPALAVDEVAEVALLRLLVVRLEPLLTRPGTHRVAHGVAQVRRQPALLDLQHLVPPPALWKPSVGPSVLRERVLELVPVLEDRLRRDDRLQPGIGDAAEPTERFRNLVVLGLHLHLVREVLEPAAAARGVVLAGRLDAVRAGLEYLGRERLGVVPLHLRHPRAHSVAGEASPDEDDEAVQPGNAVAAESERVDLELELLVSLDRGGHRPSVATVSARHRDRAEHGQGGDVARREQRPSRRA